MERVEVLGVGVHTLTWAELAHHVGSLVERGGKHTICYANAHVLNLAYRDAELQRFLNEADVCYCDGNGVRHAARLMGGEIPERMTGADWVHDLARRAEGRWRLAWVGGQPGVARAAAEALLHEHPDLQITTDHGFHTGSAEAACIEGINAFGADIVLVGMGTPTQERWVARNRHAIDAPVVWCLGATADFVAGAISRPGPDWLVQRHEWLSRLLADPRRLWRRYLVGNTLFVERVLRQRIRRL